jgi:putative YhdH/YhfP family quinone oxidoreductase
MKYKALNVEETINGFTQAIELLDSENLVPADVLVRVHYSSLNYKDALSATGNKGVTKKYPHTPGIDAAGVVVASKNAAIAVGDEVIVTSYDLGMNTPGGFAELIAVPAEWVVKLPAGLTLKEAMIIGTAGFTAGISLTRLAELVAPEDGKILITGATGGVGSVAVSLLSKLGYQTVAVSGKESEYDFLRKLGANEIISRDEFMDVKKGPVLSAKYAGAIDTVGGPILENILKMIQPLGAVTTCGSVASTQLNTTVFPFILRAITLIGISSQNYPMSKRVPLWNKLAKDWKPDHLLEIYNEINLEELPKAISLILQGKLKGRTVIRFDN